jgi:hypothetical protein
MVSRFSRLVVIGREEKEQESAEAKLLYGFQHVGRRGM